MAEFYCRLRRFLFWGATGTTLLVTGLFLASGAHAQTVDVSIPDTTVTPGSTVLIPINVSGLDQDTTGIESYGLELKFGSSGVTYQDFDVSGTLTEAAGFTIDDNPSVPRIGAFGADPINEEGASGTLLKLELDVGGSGTTEVTVDPLDFNDGNPQSNPATPSFTITAAENTAPEVVTSVPDDAIEVDAPPLRLSNLSGTVFTDADGDPLTFSASSDNAAVLTASIDQGAAVLTPQATGTAQVTLSADDGNATASTTFEMTVNQDQGGEEPTTQSSAVVSANGSSQIDFGDTGVDMNFSGVSGSGTATVKNYDSPPSDPSGISEENVSHYRIVIEAGGSLSFDSGTEIRIDVGTLEGVQDASNVTIYKRSTTGSGSFSPLATTYDPGPNELVASVSSLSEFAFGSDSEPLPVEMNALTAANDEGDAVISWRTSSETNNAGFEVQHKTPGDANFQKIGFVEGAGTTSESQTYRYRVDDLGFGTHSFRVQQLDADGTSHLSRSVTLEVEMTEAVYLTAPAPNPLRSQATVRFGVQTAQQTTVSLYNALGQRVATLYSGTPRAGQVRTVQLDANRLSSGQYYLHLRTPTDTRTQTLTISR